MIGGGNANDGKEAMTDDNTTPTKRFQRETIELHTELSADEVVARLEAAVSAEPGDGQTVGAGLDGSVSGRRVKLAAVEQNKGWAPMLKARIEETDDGAVIRGRFGVSMFAWLFGLLWVGAAGWMIYAGVEAGAVDHFMGAAFMIGCGVLVVVLGRASGKKHIPQVRERLEQVVAPRR